MGLLALARGACWQVLGGQPMLVHSAQMCDPRLVSNERLLGSWFIVEHYCTLAPQALTVCFTAIDRL